jgi:hypothetical protein
VTGWWYEFTYRTDLHTDSREKIHGCVRPESVRMVQNSFATAAAGVYGSQ